MKHDKTDPESRREFLKTGAAVSAIVGTGAAAVLLPGAVEAAPDDAPAHDEPEQKGYKVTQHVLDYYRTARS